MRVGTLHQVLREFGTEGSRALAPELTQLIICVVHLTFVTTELGIGIKFGNPLGARAAGPRSASGVTRGWSSGL